MAEIKLPTISYKEIGEKGARYALDEVEYKGLTIRQWADKITGGEYAPVVHGHWIKTSLMFASSQTGRHGNVHVCANCGEQSGVGFKTPYCAICGAKMDEEGGNDS